MTGVGLVIAMAFAADAAQAPSIPPAIQSLPPAVIDDTLEVAGDDVAARKVRSRLLLDVAVNGRGPYRFIVDSGADSSAVGKKVATDLALPVVDSATITTSTAREVVSRVKVDALTVGPTTLHGLRMPALSEAYLGGDGIIGIDALVKQRLKMDFDQRTVIVEDARKPARREPGEIVVTARRNRGQLILTEVRASGLSLQAVIDTGSEITIGNEALRRKLLRRNAGVETTIPVTGVTGVTMRVPLIIVDELQVGQILLQNVPIAFADLPPFRLFGLDSAPALLLGTDVLELFRSISLDFRARRVRFQLATCKARSADIGSVVLTQATRIAPVAQSRQCPQ